jgi:hypothetical protein
MAASFLLCFVVLIHELQQESTASQVQGTSFLSGSASGSRKQISDWDPKNTISFEPVITLIF